MIHLVFTMRENKGEFLYEIFSEEIEKKLKEKHGEVKRSLKRLDIKESVEEFYDCDAEPRSINGKHIGAPAGYRGLDRRVKKVGFSDYSKLLSFEGEERNERIEEFVKLWVVYVGEEKLEELKERCESIELVENNNFFEAWEANKDELKALKDEVFRIKKKLFERDRSGYEELSEKEREEVDERAEELIEKWSE